MELMMKAGAAILIVCTALSFVPHCRAADQFYANDDGVYGWSVEAKKNVKTTTWFVKNPADSSTYDQLTAVLYDDKPGQVYYLDKARKRVVGRLDLETEKFSLLPSDAQKVRQALEKYQFPSADSLPRVEQLFQSLQPLPEGSGGNHERLALPPPTFQHPRLEHSEWDSSYMSADRFTIRCTVRLDGDEGTYQLRDKPGTGRLSDVTYERGDEEHIIRGNWALGQSRGDFQFKVPAENLNVFWGEFGFQPGKTVGAWSGVRRPPGASKITERSIR
jgi:hypothetical protein